MSKVPPKKDGGKIGKVAPPKRYTTITVPMDQAFADAFFAAASAEGESLTEFVYGGCCMSLAQDLRLLENFLAGFALNGTDVKRLGQLAVVRKAAEENRLHLTELLTSFLASKHRVHREDEKAKVDRAVRGGVKPRP